MGADEIHQVFKDRYKHGGCKASAFACSLAKPPKHLESRLVLSRIANHVRTCANEPPSWVWKSRRSVSVM